MGYTDKELRDATQVAYMNLQSGYDNLVNLGIAPPYTIQQIIDATTDKIVRQKLEKKIEEGDMDIDLKAWKITQIHDKNEKNGFYGCIIETSDNEAIVAFRGSEDPKEGNQLEYDWIKGDIGLLNSTLTSQHAELKIFLDEIKVGGYLNQYTSVASTGHSLGGNLSDYFTILSVKYGFNNKIKQSVSFDGPGFSQEFMDEYKPKIDAVRKVMTHFQWSAVGNMLFPVPGVEAHTAGVKSYADTSPFLQGEYGKKVYYLIARHDTRSLQYDDQGNIITGEMDPVAWLAGKVSRGIDRLPSGIGNSMASGLTYLILHGEEIKGKFVDENGLSLLGVGLVAPFVIRTLTNPASLAVYAIEIAETILLVSAAVGIECLIELFESAIRKVSQWVSDAKEFAIEKVAAFKNLLEEAAVKVEKLVKDAASFAIGKAIEAVGFVIKKYRDGKEIVLEKWEALKNEAEAVCVKAIDFAKQIGADGFQQMVKKILEAKKLLVTVKNTIQNIKFGVINNAKEKITLAGDIAKSLGKNVASKVKKKYESLKNVTITAANKFTTQVTSKIRDYSKSKLEELEGLYSSITSIDFYDMSSWTRKYASENWFGRLNISPIQSAASKLTSSIQTEGAKVLNKAVGIFEEVQTMDDTFAEYLNTKKGELNTIIGLLD